MPEVPGARPLFDWGRLDPADPDEPPPGLSPGEVLPEDEEEEDGRGRLLRVVFDEGHHLFSAADSAFSAHLTGGEMLELRRWLLGAEEGRSSRARGLKARLEDLLPLDPDMAEPLDALLAAARGLPREGWLGRMSGEVPVGASERFLWELRRLVYARAQNPRTPYDIEIHAHPAPQPLLDAGEALSAGFSRLAAPAAELIRRLRALLAERGAELDTDTKRRIEAVSRGLWRRLPVGLGAWQRMLADLAEGAQPGFVDWMGVARQFGRDSDLGLYRHWVDPMRPFSHYVLGRAQSVAVTSATLTDSGAEDWAGARMETGTRHLLLPARESRIDSPFDYAAQSRVMVVTDVPRDDLDQVAGAFRALFEASGGGALGLFTAIARLRRVHDAIAGRLEERGIPLLSQHVDPLPLPSLIDIFRAHGDACLLGTDALRDGIDVPGRALRLIVFDRVPWPLPSILHRARREEFGGKAYDDRLARRKLRQAYGRLIRRAGDRGVFVMLDSAMPSRLESAFPPGVAVERTGLAETVSRMTGFLAASMLGEGMSGDSNR
jgi:ATP-dependent DNA helicase DinG